MSSLVTKDFSVGQALNFARSFDNVNPDSYYMSFGDHTPNAQDSIVPKTTNNPRNTFYDIVRQLIFGKIITKDNVRLCITKRDWVSGKVYDYYDDLSTGQEKDDFFVITKEAEEYSVFKCIYNNGGAPSSHKPLKSETSATDELYETSDNYVWKYMFSVSTSEYNRFATDKYFPVFENTEVKTSSVSGSIDAVEINDQTTRFDNYADAAIFESSVGGNDLVHSIIGDDFRLSSNTNYYNNCSVYVRDGSGSGQLRTITGYTVTENQRLMRVDEEFSPNIDNTSVLEITPKVIIEGDGQDFACTVGINHESNTVQNVNIINRGYDYTHAVATIYENGIDNTKNIGGIVRPIISPRGGHGANSHSELYADTVAIAVDMDGSEGERIPTTNDYRTISIIKNPIFLSNSITLDSVVGLETGDELTGQYGTIATVTSIDVETFEVGLKNIRGRLTVGDTMTSGDFEAEITDVETSTAYFDARTIMDIEMISFGSDGSDFVADEIVRQPSTNATGYVHELGDGKIYVTEITGRFKSSVENTGVIEEIVGDFSGARAKINNISNGELDKYSGDVIYIDRSLPITRDTLQTERIRFFFNF